MTNVNTPANSAPSPRGPGPDTGQDADRTPDMGPDTNPGTRPDPVPVSGGAAGNRSRDLERDGTVGDLRLGVFVPTVESAWPDGLDPRGVLDFGVRAERLGLDSLWVNDSLLSPRIEAMTALAALAATTEQVTLGTGTLLPALRTPVQAAHTIASVDRLSGGRLVLGVGAGFPGRFGEPVYAMAGTPWPRRFTRLDETVELWRRLWTEQQPVTYEGRILRFDDVPPPLRPVRPQGPPIWLGGATPTALARAGRLYDGWFPYPPDPAEYAAGLSAIRAEVDRTGRGGRPFSPALFVNVLVTDAADGGRSVLDAYAHRTYGAPIAWLEKIQAVAAGPAGVVAERLVSYVAAGVRHIVARCAALNAAGQRAQLEALAALRPLLDARVTAA